MKTKRHGQGKGPVSFGGKHTSKRPKHGRLKMNSEPRTVELSRDNFNSAIESFLRATDVIHDSETPVDMITVLNGHAPVKITIHFKQEEKENQTTVH